MLACDHRSTHAHANQVRGSASTSWRQRPSPRRCAWVCTCIAPGCERWTRVPFSKPRSPQVCMGLAARSRPSRAERAASATGKRCFVPKVEDKSSNMRLLHLGKTYFVASSIKCFTSRSWRSNSVERTLQMRCHRWFRCHLLGSWSRVITTAMEPHVKMVRAQSGMIYVFAFKCKTSIHFAVIESDRHMDVLLMPGLAFDRSGKRLGRGGG